MRISLPRSCTMKSPSLYIYFVFVITLIKYPADAGVYLLYEGEVVQNHGIVLFKYSTTVNCLTDSPHSNIGTWFYPNGAAVSSSSSDPLLYQVRWTSVVSLNRKNGDLPSYGIYRCDIPDNHGFIYSLYVGLYDDSGAPEIESLTYKPLTTTEAPTPVFTLTCTSTGGPASTVTWTKDCTPVPNDINHLQSKSLLDGDTGTYASVLTVTGPDYGEYKCIVTNSKGSAASTGYTITAVGVSSSENTPCMWLTFAGRMVQSHGIVIQEEIGTEDHTALQCWSDSDLAEFMWYFPDETQVPFGEDHGYDVYQRNGSNVVYLQNTVDNRAVNGIYSCHGENQRLVVGIYTDTPGTTGTPVVKDGIQVEAITSSDTTLTCTTSGGPATTVVWTRDCVQLPSDMYSSSTVLLDAETATYNSTLTVAGDLTGEYRCIFVNDRGAAVANYSSGCSHLERSNCNSIWLILKGQVLSNNSLVTLENVWEGEESLQCWTDRQDCCHSDYTTGGALGKWSYPDGSKVKFAVSYELSDMTRPLYRDRRHQAVIVHRKKGGEDGVYYCEIPDEQGVTHRVYVGMYSATGRAGVPGIIGKIQFELQTQAGATIPIFKLTCTSTGGPPTNATWTRDGTDVLTDENAGDFVPHQVVVDTKLATYYNILTVTGRHEGLYKCHVSNDKGSLSVPNAFLVRGPAIPELSSPVAVTATTVNMSWSEQPYNHSDYRVIDHYELHAIPVAGSCNAVGGIAAIVSGTTTHHVLSGLEENTTYAITITAVNNLGRSDTSMEMEVATRPTAPSAAPEVLQSNMASTSVLIWWGNVSCIELNSDLLGYTIHYSSKGEGDDWNTINMVGSINTYNITGLTPYTNYSVKVAAMNTLGDLGPYSGTVTVQTLEDIPGPVESLVSLIQVTAITLTWSPPTHPNGVIITYELLFEGSENISAVNTTAMSYQLTGLDPQQNYTIQVRTYTSVGPSASRMVECTPLEITSVRNVRAEAINSSTVLVLWDPLELPGVIVLNYTIFYTTVELHQGREIEGVVNALSQEYPPYVTHGFISNLTSNHSYQFHVRATMDIGGDVFVGETSNSNDTIVQLLVANPASPTPPMPNECETGETGETESHLAIIIVAVVLLVVIVMLVVIAIAAVAVCTLQSKRRRDLHITRNEKQEEQQGQQSQEVQVIEL